MVRSILIFSLILLLTSCSAKYACKDTVDIQGERCDPISTVYEKKVLEEGRVSPGEKKKKGNNEPGVSPSEDVNAVKNLFYEEEKPLRLPPKVIRVWIAPWEDADGDLYQPSYIYSEISPKRGRWFFGEKEVVTTQPILRPIEKLTGDLKKTEGEEKKKGEGKKKDETTDQKKKRGLPSSVFPPGP